MFKINGEFKDNAKETVDLNNWAFEEIQQIKTKEIQTHEDGRISHLSNCLISVTPFQHEEPFYLFGSNRRSIVANKVSIYEALVDTKVANDAKPGRLITEFIITDENLSNALIQQGHEGFPFSYSNLDGNILNPFEGSILNNSVDRNAISTEQTLDYEQNLMLKQLEILLKELEKARPSKKVVSQALKSLNSQVCNLKENADYQLTELINSLKKDISSFNFELSGTIEKLHFYNAIGQTGILENLSEKEVPQESYLHWYAKGGFSDEEVRFLIKVFKNIEERFPNEKLVKHIKSLNSRFVDMQRDTGAITDGLIAFNTVYGDTNAVDEENYNGRILEMRLGLGTIEETYKVRFQQYKSLMHIALSTNDIVLLLRSSRTKTFINGRITRFANQSVPFVKLQKFIQDDLNYKNKNLHLDNDLKKLFEDIDKAFEGSMKKGDKEKLRQLIFNFKNELEKTCGEFKNISEDERDKIKTIFEERVVESIKNSTAALPHYVIKKTLDLLN